MKKLLLAFTLLAGGTAHAQITGEHTYPTLVCAGKLSTGETKYAGYISSSSTTGQVRIYNANHSLYKQVNVTIPVDSDVNSITYLSDKLFNTNAGVEFVLNLVNVSSTVYDGMRILDENGAVLFARDTVSYPTIYNTATGTKMQVDRYRAAAGGASSSKIYALGGILTAARVASGTTTDDLLPYPNPASTEVRLPYTVAAGQVAQLVVRAATGQQVRSYQVDSTFDHLLFSARGLAPGVYFYTVGNGSARRFTVQ